MHYEKQYDLCKSGEGYVLGPLAELDHQAWNFNEDMIDSADQATSPEFQISETGSYSASMHNAGCIVETPVLNTIRHGCNECGERPVIGEITTIFNNDLCAFNVPITISNTSFDPLQITLSNDLDNFVIVPATIQIPANDFITVQLTVYPVNGFVPNSTYQITVFGVYTTPEFMPSYCSSSFEIILEDCIADRIAPNPFKETFSSFIDYYPNPVLNSLKVTWTDSNSVEAISIYDLTGRKVLETTVQKESLEKELYLEALPSGVYVMMVKNNTTIIGQYKIIKQ